MTEMGHAHTFQKPLVKVVEHSREGTVPFFVIRIRLSIQVPERIFEALGNDTCPKQRLEECCGKTQFMIFHQASNQVIPSLLHAAMLEAADDGSFLGFGQTIQVSHIRESPAPREFANNEIQAAKFLFEDFELH